MEVNVHKSQAAGDWKEVYKAALFEDDNIKIPQRIAEAEMALAARALELFGADADQLREQQALENARYFLHILGSMAGTISGSSEYVRPRRHLPSNASRRRNPFVIPDAAQDLHTLYSPTPLCNE